MPKASDIKGFTELRPDLWNNVLYSFNLLFSSVIHKLKIYSICTCHLYKIFKQPYIICCCELKNTN